ncbi:MAG: LysM peptidoglycan-binding domain-containing protein [Bacillota bacterium]|jgi:hypothetical protein
MSNSGLAKVSRRRYNLETVVFSAQQEVTVPAGLKIPVSTQYVLQPFLVVPREKVIILPGPGKIRVQGQTEGFLSYVDRDESVSTLPVPPTEFIASFAVPSAVQGARIEADIRLEGVEVDRGDGEANITAYIRVAIIALRQEETELVTAVAGNALSAESRGIKLQHIVKEAEAEKSISIPLSQAAGKPVATDFCIGNLGWQVIEGRLSAQGVALVKAYYISEAGGLDIAEGSADFELEIDFASPEISDCALQCLPVKTAMAPAAEGQEFQLLLKARAQGYREQTGEYITEIIGADSLKKTIQVRNRVGESEFKLNLEGQYQFPIEPQSIDLVLPKVRLIETEAMDEKVLVRGLLSLNIYYTAEDGQRRVLVQEEEFIHYLEATGCALGYSVKAWAWPEQGVYTQENYSVPVLLRVEVVEDAAHDVVIDVHVVDPNFIPVNASVILYVTGKDDTLFSVARKFNISQERLLEYNGLAGETELHAGQKLLIPIYELKY